MDRGIDRSEDESTTSRKEGNITIIIILISDPRIRFRDNGSGSDLISNKFQIFSSQFFYQIHHCVPKDSPLGGYLYQNKTTVKKR